MKKIVVTLATLATLVVLSIGASFATPKGDCCPTGSCCKSGACCRHQVK